jgi:hypothetical protein
MAQLGLSRRGRGKEGRKSWRGMWRQDLGPERGPGSLDNSRDGKPLQQLAWGAGAPSCAFAEGGSTGTGSDQRTLRGHKREKWEVGEEREGGGGGGECCAVVLPTGMQALGGNSL